LGELRVGFLGPEMVHPQIRVVREGVPLKESLTPVYPPPPVLAKRHCAS